MAFYSTQCVDCTETTKKCTGEYRGTDGKGKHFSGSLYACENPACKISYERRKTQRQLQTAACGDGVSSVSDNRRRSKGY